MRLIIGCVNLTELLRAEMADGATSDGSEHTTSVAPKETGTLHEVSPNRLSQNV